VTGRVLSYHSVMAIQLDCPHCFSTTRVPDRAAGTTIACPKCRGRMRVPAVKIPVAASAAPQEAFADVFAAPAAPALDSPFFSDAEDESPAEPVNPHLALARRNKRRMSRGWIGVMLAFLLAAIGISGTWWWSNRQNIVRTASASVVANATLSKDLSATEFNVQPADWSAMEAALRINPVDLTDPKMKVQFGTGPKGLQLSLTPTNERMLVAVPTSTIPELQEPRTQAALQEAWKEALTQSLSKMSRTVQDAIAGGVKPSLANYGESVGMDGLAGPTGFHFRAAVGTTAYPCVFEDANRQLYFLVPPGTKSLAVIPRDVGARNSLPEKMRITATVK